MKFELKKEQWIKLFIHIFITVPIGLFILVSCVIFIYIYWPSNAEKVGFELPSETQHLFIVSHGLKDSPSTWAQPLANKLNDNFPDSKAIAVDWSQEANNAFKCSVSGMRIGERLGELISKQKGIKSVHLIGHSCGSFINLGMCEAIKSSSNIIKVQTTYLDPVAIYGGMFWQYGVDYFGSCADFSDAYIDTQDNVPGSNQALANSYSFNVTELKNNKDEDIHPHLWPTKFYQEYLSTSNFLTINNKLPKLNCRKGSLINFNVINSQCIGKE